MKKYILYAILLLSSGLFYCIDVNAQQTSAGKDFWVSFGPNGRNPLAADGRLQLRIVATKACTVSLNYTTAGVTDQTLTMTAGEVRTIVVSSSLYHSIDNSGRSTKSMKVTSSENIYLYALNQSSQSTEATTVFPVPTYGTEYYHLSYTPYSNTQKDGFLVIANEDGTQLSVNGSSIATLNTGDVWYYTGGAGIDITGRRIQTSKPVAVFSVNSGARVVAGGYDNLFEQMVSVDKWGMEFFIPVTVLREEKVRIIASENNTAVRVQYQSSTSNYTINRGQRAEITITDKTRGAYITADKPISIGIYMVGKSNGSGDPSLAGVPAIPQMVTDTVTIAPFQPIGTTELRSHYSQVVVRTSDKNQTMRYNSRTMVWSPVTSGWTDHRSGYSYLNETMATNNTMKIYYCYHNPAGILVWGYGRGNYESYHYMTASTFKRLDCQMYINGISFEEIEGQKLNTCKTLEIEGEVTVPVNPSQSYIVWYIDGILQNLPQNTLKWTSPVLTPGNHTIRMVVTNSSGTEIPVECTFEISQEDYIWTGNAGDSNWNNPDNWILTTGTTSFFVPQDCHNVYIPGGLPTYPSLENNILQSGPVKTDPQCDSIILHFGAELAWPHKLMYERAFCEYNFGYYKSFTGVTTGDMPSNNRDEELYGGFISNYAAPMMKRSQFYYLGFPLKKVVTGDLSFAGYPKTYASVYGKPENPKLASITPVNGYYNFAYNGILLEELRNSAMLNVGGYNSTEKGLDDHANLEGLQGVIRLPYFEESASQPFYPQHAYSPVYTESYLYYFDNETLQLMYGVRDTVARAEEAYRFIFEDDNRQLRQITLNNGQTVTGYSVKTRSDEDHFYLGNPFPASINSGLFRDANAAYLDTSRPSFTLLKNDGSSGEDVFPYSPANNIPALSGFGVYINNSLLGQEIEWFFPLEDTYALTGSTYKGVFPLAFNNSVKIYLSQDGSSSADRAILASGSDYQTDLMKLNLPPTDYIQPELFFTSLISEEKNMLQVMKNENAKSYIGIRAMDTENDLRLVFEGIENMTGNITDVSSSDKKEIFILEDLRTGTKINLSATPYYVFRQIANKDNNDFMDVKRFALYAGEEHDLTNGGITINFYDGRLEIFSNYGIKHLNIYNMVGQKIFIKAGMSEADRNLSLALDINSGIYLVYVTDYTGKEFTQKIFVR